MQKIVIIGSGVVGAMIAYELSLNPQFKITLLDEQEPAGGSTGKALGVLMGIISHKKKGRGWRLRQESLSRYETLIPELEALTGDAIAYNRQGLVKLLFEGDALEKWQKLVQFRASQGYDLQLWNQEQLRAHCPAVQFDSSRMIGAVYSPQDRQINPTQLTQALVTGAKQNGVTCQFGVTIAPLQGITRADSNQCSCREVITEDGVLPVDSLIIAGGIGSTKLTTELEQPLDIRPVLGQGLQLKINHQPENPSFQPVVTGNDVHVVPLGKGEYWLGATVEFTNAQGDVTPDPQLLEAVKTEAYSFYPALQEAEIVRHWVGLRPRPEGRPAPIIEPLMGYDNVILATGHYRNGILLAPATAIAIRNLMNS